MFREKSEEELEKQRARYERNPMSPEFAPLDSGRVGVVSFAALLLLGTAVGTNIVYKYLQVFLELLPPAYPNLSAFILGCFCVAVGRIMFSLKQDFLFFYAWAEIGFAFGAGAIAWQQYKVASTDAVLVSIFGAIYVGVRGFDNRKAAKAKAATEMSLAGTSAKEQASISHPL